MCWKNDFRRSNDNIGSRYVFDSNALCPSQAFAVGKIWFLYIVTLLWQYFDKIHLSYDERQAFSFWEILMELYLLFFHIEDLWKSD